MKRDRTRQKLQSLIEARGYTLTSASREIGRNQGYLRTYITKAVPRYLPLEVREGLAQLLGLDVRQLDEWGGIQTEFQYLVIEEVDARVDSISGRFHDTAPQREEWRIPAKAVPNSSGGEVDRFKLLIVAGDGARPFVDDGERVLVDISDKEPSPPGLFVIWDGRREVVKRLERKGPASATLVEVRAPNGLYDAETLVQGEIVVVGRVVARWGRL